MGRLKLGVLVSGNGSNLQAILDAIAAEQLDAEVRVVISNRPNAFALERARQAQVSALCIDHKQFSSRADFDVELVRQLGSAGVEWIVLAGFMRLLTPRFLEAFPDRILNIHPALLPAFVGVDAIGQAFRYGVKVTGCTVHLVDEGTDTGPIVAQQAIEVLPNDDEASLTERMHEAEHQLYVGTLRRIAQTGLRVVRSETRAKVLFEAP